MKKNFLTSVFCIFAMTKIAFAQNTGSNPCENVRFEPMLNFTTSYGKLRYDHSYSQKELQKLGQAFGVNEHGMFTSGLSVASIEWEVMLDTVSKVVNAEDICIVPTVVDVFVGFQNPTIYISNHLKQGTCEYNLVMRHEHQHQQMNIVALEYFIPKIKEELEKRLKDVKPHHAPSLSRASAVTAEMTDEYIKLIAPYINKFKASLLREQSLLDTRENYEKEDAVCRKGLKGLLGI